MADSTPTVSVMCALGQPAHIPVSRTSAQLPLTDNQLDVSPVGLEKRPYLVQDALDAFSGNH